MIRESPWRDGRRRMAEGLCGQFAAGVSLTRGLFPQARRPVGRRLR